jgi:hypothetical protein
MLNRSILASIQKILAYAVREWSTQRLPNAHLAVSQLPKGCATGTLERFQTAKWAFGQTMK